ncbi:hypothetical protein CPB85DRAFT_1290874 [Mucidula mucida]|nr:hypothetical protein CPB85DRAFT_1290874 [Mucidula mucida]
MEMDPEIALARARLQRSLTKKSGQACSTCRRDKVKCNQLRPCDVCIKKRCGHQCLTGCIACRTARVRCQPGQGERCRRCEESNENCISAALKTRKGLPLSTSAPRKDRVKLACLGCRSEIRRYEIMCDTQRPCTRCVIKGKTCEPGEKSAKSSKLRCDACRKGNKKCGDDRPCALCIENGEPCKQNEKRKGGHGTRIKQVCRVFCRRRKIKCDQEFPCGPCDRNNYECSNGELPQSPAPNEPSRSVAPNVLPSTWFPIVPQAGSSTASFPSRQQHPTHFPVYDSGAGATWYPEYAQYHRPAD